MDVPLGKLTATHLEDEGGLKHQTLHQSIHVLEDFRLRAGLPTLEMCLTHAASVIVLGHIGRPGGKEVRQLSVGPIVEWMEKNLDFYWDDEKFKVMENLRFEPGEDAADLSFAKELAVFGDIYINEAFAAYRPAASTTILPKLLPHAAGLNFVQEVLELTRLTSAPERPFVVIMGGAKVEDKLPVIEEMAKIADVVLIGGKLPVEIKERSIQVAANVMVGKLNEPQTDLAPETTESWALLIKNAQTILWNGPLGLVEEAGNEQTLKVAEMVLDSGARTIIGGGDSISYFHKLGLLDQFSFVSTGGGAMLKLLADGTLSTIEALK